MSTSAPTAAAEPRLATRSLTWWLRRLGPVVALFLVYLLFAALAPRTFPTLDNAQLLVTQSAIVGTTALGMTVLMIAGGIDLSVGSIVALGAVVVALVLRAPAVEDTSGIYPQLVLPGAWAVWWPLVAVSAGIAAAALCGALNATLVTAVRIRPFIVTLGTMLVVRGAAQGLANQQRVSAPDTWLPRLMARPTGSWSWTLLPPGVWVMFAVAAVLALMLVFTRLGRQVFAVGSSELTARLCGVPVAGVRFFAYTLVAACAGLSAVFLFARQNVGSPTEGMAMELNVIAAVVIGGGSLAGGQGSILGALAGALLMTVISNGCSHLGLPQWVQLIVTGGIIVLAVAIDQLSQRRS